MAKSNTDKMLEFLDQAGPRIDQALKATSKQEWNTVMDSLMNDFLNLDLSEPKRRRRTAKPKVRRGIGSY